MYKFGIDDVEGNEGRVVGSQVLIYRERETLREMVNSVFSSKELERNVRSMRTIYFLSNRTILVLQISDLKP